MYVSSKMECFSYKNGCGIFVSRQLTGLGYWFRFISNIMVLKATYAVQEIRIKLHEMVYIFKIITTCFLFGMLVHNSIQYTFIIRTCNQEFII